MEYLFSLLIWLYFTKLQHSCQMNITFKASKWVKRMYFQEKLHIVVISRLIYISCIYKLNESCYTSSIIRTTL